MPYRLGWLDEEGRPHVARKLHGRDRQRVMRHMEVFKTELNRGHSRTAAIMKARVAEHKGMTPEQIQRYEGHLGAIARYNKKGKR
jgi:hypothetical protein